MIMNRNLSRIIVIFIVLIFLPGYFSDQLEQTESKKNDEEKISIRVKDADIKDVLMILADVSGKNIILDPTVKGKVTVNLKDVTWREALHAILFITGLGYVEYESNGYIASYDKMIGRVGTFERKDTDKKTDKKQMVTLRYPISFDKAKETWKQIKPVLSEDGKFQYDRRSNVAIIIDYPENAHSALDILIIYSPKE